MLVIHCHYAQDHLVMYVNNWKFLLDEVGRQNQTTLHCLGEILCTRNRKR